MDKSERDALIVDVLDGRKTPDEAEADARRLGLDPLASSPDPALFDPMEVPSWTLLMAIAWIVWRSPNKVREWWAEYRVQCLEWRLQEWGGHALIPTKRPPTFWDLWGAQQSEAETGILPEDAVSAHYAKDCLFMALADGRLQASHLSERSATRLAIPKGDWHELTIPPKGPAGDVIERRDEFHGYVPYHGVTCERTAITHVWPESGPKPFGFADPEIASPRGGGYMPLSCAAQWIATQGNALDSATILKDGWQRAYRGLVNAIASERISVIGSRDGQMEQVPAIQFAACQVDFPWLVDTTKPSRPDDVSLRSYLYRNEAEWLDGFDDALFVQHTAKWKRIMAAKADVAREWPFNLNSDAHGPIESAAIRTGAPGRPTSMHLVKAEHAGRWDRGDVENTVKAQAEALSSWLSNAHPLAPPLTAKTIENGIRDDYRQ